MIRSALALGLLVVLAGDADAYVRTRSSHGTGNPSAWPGTCVFVMPDSAGSPDLPSDQVFSIIQKSMANWNTNGCSYLQLMYDQPTVHDAHYDGTNVIKFRTDKWCHPIDPQNTPEVCYSEQAAAITSVFMINDGEPADGTILDADIEVNNLNFTFVVITPGATPPVPRIGTSIADLENTLTHELGHLQGLSHTCKDAASFPNDVDENGNPPPSCDAIPADEVLKIKEATMYNFASPGETIKRSPTDDDLAGICNAYPVAKNPNMCTHTDLAKLTQRGGCELGAFRDAAPFGVPALLLALAFALRLRRRHRDCT